MIRAAVVLCTVGTGTNLRVPHPLRSLQRMRYATASFKTRDIPSVAKARSSRIRYKPLHPLSPARPRLSGAPKVGA